MVFEKPERFKELNLKNQQHISSIILFSFKRAKNILSLINESLKTSLNVYVFHDFDTSIENRELYKQLRKIPEIILISRKENYGLKKNLFEGINHVANISDSFIVIEDDLSVKAKDITALSNQIKENINSEVFEVSGFPISGKSKISYPLEIPLGTSWFWGTSSNKWNAFYNDFLTKNLMNFKINIFKFDYNFRYPFSYLLYLEKKGKVSSWAIYKHIYIIKHNLKAKYIFAESFNFYKYQNEFSTHGENNFNVHNFSKEWKKNLLYMSKNSRVTNLIKYIKTCF